MARDTRLKKVQPSGGALVPSIPEYMREDAGAGLQDVQDYVIVPRLKIVQKQASEELLSKFNVGDVILVPLQQLIVPRPVDARGKPSGEASTFDFSIVFFFAEWCTWNPISLKGVEPAILYRTVNPKDPVVAKAKNPALREERHPTIKGEKVHHCEHLNFVIVMQGEERELLSEPTLITFARGEHRVGAKLCSLARMRQSAVYGGVYTATLAKRSNQKGEWWGLDVQNGDTKQWVDEEEYPRLRALHEQYAELHRNAKLVANYDDEPIDVDAGADDDAEPAAKSEKRF